MEVLLGGLLAGLGWGLTGYFRNKARTKDNKQYATKIDYKKLSKSVFVGGLVGLYATYTGTTMSFVEASQMYIPIVAVSQKIIDILYDTYKNKVVG